MKTDNGDFEYWEWCKLKKESSCVGIDDCPDAKRDTSHPLGCDHLMFGAVGHKKIRFGWGNKVD